MPNFCRPVEKINQDGKVIARYPSIRDSATANYMCETAIRHRCEGKIKKQYDSDGHTYRYAEGE